MGAEDKEEEYLDERCSCLFDHPDQKEEKEKADDEEYEGGKEKEGCLEKEEKEEGKKNQSEEQWSAHV